MVYQCAKCGMVHEGMPAIGFSTPHQYNMLSEGDRERYVKELNDDFCVIEYEDQTDRFIRAVLFQKVIDYCEDLQYGVWVSLSEKSFDNYIENFFSENQEVRYFGYLCTSIPPYRFEPIKTDVVLAPGRQRPEIVPHEDQINEIDFVRDYYNGITKTEADRRIAEVMRSN